MLVGSYPSALYITVLWLPPGNLKVDISAPFENMPCCLTSNLWEVSVQSFTRVYRDIQECPKAFLSCNTEKEVMLLV